MTIFKIISWVALVLEIIIRPVSKGYTDSCYNRTAFNCSRKNFTRVVNAGSHLLPSALFGNPLAGFCQLRTASVAGLVRCASNGLRHIRFLARTHGFEIELVANP
jgi:hypothetical protein